MDMMIDEKTELKALLHDVLEDLACVDGVIHFEDVLDCLYGAVTGFDETFVLTEAIAYVAHYGLVLKTEIA
jgi:hypothetical protein